MKRFEKFNERNFEAYCKKSIDHAILKERQKKAAMSQMERPLSDLTESLFQALSVEDDITDHIKEECQIFQVQDMSFYISNQKLSRALMGLLPKDWEIVLLYFFGGLKDKEIALFVKKDRTTVFRRRKAAIEQLRTLLGDTT